MSDWEISAMSVIAGELSQLDRPTCQRVLHWAHERFISAPLGLDDEGLASFSTFAEGLGNVAQTIGGVTAADLICAAREFARLRDEQAS